MPRAYADMPKCHVVWHLFVLLGTLAQFFTILFYIVLRDRA